jgi:hypothetical protein
MRRVESLVFRGLEFRGEEVSNLSTLNPKL